MRRARSLPEPSDKDQRQSRTPREWSQSARGFENQNHSGRTEYSRSPERRRSHESSGHQSHRRRDSGDRRSYRSSRSRGWHPPSQARSFYSPRSSRNLSPQVNKNKNKKRSGRWVRARKAAAKRRTMMSKQAAREALKMTKAAQLIAKVINYL